MLPKADKDLYIQLRDRKLTFAQFAARVYKMNGLADYIVLDDVKDVLAECVIQNVNPNAKNMDTKELLRPLEAWEVNPKCTRSIKYHHNPNKKQ